MVTVYDGLVLLLGEVASDKAAGKGNRSCRIALQSRPGQSLQLHHRARPNLSPCHTNDRYLSAKVKSRLLVASGVPAGKVKVVTENGVVYLMGKITRADGELVVAEVQKSFGVQKIVKVFDYLSDPGS